MVRFTLVLPLIPIAILSIGCGRSLEARQKLAADTAEKLQAQLLTALTKAIAEKGAAGAIDTCHTLSPETEKNLTTQGVSVRRVSDRTRNPSHKPDEWEAKALATWRVAMSEGRELAPVMEETPSGLRFAKPIKIGNEACLQCHGNPAKMKGDVKAAIAKLYPEDQAIGYAMGDLRGAISITVK